MPPPPPNQPTNQPPPRPPPPPPPPPPDVLGWVRWGADRRERRQEAGGDGWEVARRASRASPRPRSAGRRHLGCRAQPASQWWRRRPRRGRRRPPFWVRSWVPRAAHPLRPGGQIEPRSDREQGNSQNPREMHVRPRGGPLASARGGGQGWCRPYRARSARRGGARGFDPNTHTHTLGVRPRASCRARDPIGRRAEPRTGRCEGRASRRARGLP